MTPEQVEAQLRFAEAAGLEVSPPCDLDPDPSQPCRYASDPLHVCWNDGPVRPGGICLEEARAQLVDKTLRRKP